MKFSIPMYFAMLNHRNNRTRTRALLLLDATDEADMSK